MKKKKADEKRDQAFMKMKEDANAFMEFSKRNLELIANEDDAETRKMLLENALSNYERFYNGFVCDILSGFYDIGHVEREHWFNIGGTLGSLATIAGGFTGVAIIRKLIKK